MARLPTVTLRDPAGKVRIVNEFDYAADISAWQAAGFRRVGETHGDASADVEAYAAQQAEIERERKATREAPKDFEARKTDVRSEEPEAGASEPADPRVEPGADTSSVAPAIEPEPQATASATGQPRRRGRPPKGDRA